MFIIVFSLPNQVRVIVIYMSFLYFNIVINGLFASGANPKLSYSTVWDNNYYNTTISSIQQSEIIIIICNTPMKAIKN